jgi:hypothetical protein
MMVAFGMVDGPDTLTDRQLERIERLVAKVETAEAFLRFLEIFFRKGGKLMKRLDRTLAGCTLRFCFATKVYLLAKDLQGDRWIGKIREILGQNEFDLGSLRRDLDQNALKGRLGNQSTKVAGKICNEGGQNGLFGSVKKGDGICLTDFDGLIFWINRAGRKLLGIKNGATEKLSLTDSLDFEALRPSQVPARPHPHPLPQTPSPHPSLHESPTRICFPVVPQRSIKAPDSFLGIKFFVLSCPQLTSLLRHPDHSQNFLPTNFATFLARHQLAPQSFVEASLQPTFLLCVLSRSSPGH